MWLRPEQKQVLFSGEQVWDGAWKRGGRTRGCRKAHAHASSWHAWLWTVLQAGCRKQTCSPGAWRMGFQTHWSVLLPQLILDPGALGMSERSCTWPPFGDGGP